MRRLVEIGWDHECCGPAYERNLVVELTCRRAPGHGTDRYVEVRHAADERDLVRVRGRVLNLFIVHPDGSAEEIDRLPGGDALLGFDGHDDGHLERPWTGEPVVADSHRHLVEIAG